MWHWPCKRIGCLIVGSQCLWIEHPSLQVEALKWRPGVRVVSITREDRDRKMQEVLAALQAALRCKP